MLPIVSDYWPVREADVMARRSEHAEQVGAWIQARRIELGMTQAQLADEVGGSPRTVRNAESGATAVMQLSRAAWERALGWPPLSLTAAYRHGQHPEVRPAVPEVDADRLRVLMAAGIPPELCSQKDVREVLDSELPPEAQIRILQIWLAGHHSRNEFERMFDEARTLPRIVNGGPGSGH